MVWDFWSCWSGLLAGQLDLCARLRHWIADGLTLEDARLAFGELTSPNAAGMYVYRGDLMAAIAGRLAAHKRRRQAAGRAAERRESEQPAPATDVAAILRRIGNDPSG